MSCGCGCNNCGDEKPRVNGTEVTILSGVGGTHSNARSNDGHTQPKSNSGTYAIIGTALVVALFAAYNSCRKGS